MTPAQDARAHHTRPRDDQPDAPADTAGPLDMLLADAALGPARRFVPGMAMARFAARLASRPRRWPAAAGGLGAELAGSPPGSRSWRPAARTAGSPTRRGPATRCCAGCCRPTWPARPPGRPASADAALDWRTGSGSASS